MFHIPVNFRCPLQNNSTASSLAAFITAGSVITADVEPEAMAFGRARQEVRPGRAAAFRAARKKEK